MARTCAVCCRTSSSGPREPSTSSIALTRWLRGLREMGGSVSKNIYASSWHLNSWQQVLRREIPLLPPEPSPYPAAAAAAAAAAPGPHHHPHSRQHIAAGALTQPRGHLQQVALLPGHRLVAVIIQKHDAVHAAEPVAQGLHRVPGLAARAHVTHGGRAGVVPGARGGGAGGCECWRPRLGGAHHHRQNMMSSPLLAHGGKQTRR